MQKPVIAIDSRMYSYEWEAAFAGELMAKGAVKPGEVVYYESRPGPPSIRQDAKEVLEAAKKEARWIVIPILHPFFHKNYLLHIATLAERLQADERTIAVFDMEKVPDGITGAYESQFMKGDLDDEQKKMMRQILGIVTVVSIDNLIDYYKKLIHSHQRVMKRPIAIEFFASQLVPV